PRAGSLAELEFHGERVAFVDEHIHRLLAGQEIVEVLGQYSVRTNAYPSVRIHFVDLSRGEHGFVQSDFVHAGADPIHVRRIEPSFAKQDFESDAQLAVVKWLMGRASPNQVDELLAE